MDLWVVGAAAAAGYIAKHWQNLSRDRSVSSELPLEASEEEKPKNPGRPVHRLRRRKELVEDSSSDERKVSDGKRPVIYHDASESGVVCNGYDEQLECFCGYEDYNVLSMSRSPSGLSMTGNLDNHEHESGLAGNRIDNSSELSVSVTDLFGSTNRNRMSFRTRHPRETFVKPVNALESCLVAQLYNELGRMEEYVFSPSPSAAMRPLLVTDGHQIISRADNDSFCAWNGYNRPRKKESMHGLSLPPKPGSVHLSKKIKYKSEVCQNVGLSNSRKEGNRMLFHSQNGLQDEMLLFCLGLSMGIISSLIANRIEVDKLKELLDQKENLVQDLHDELEMKDSLTVKELSNENSGSQDTSQSFFRSSARNPLFDGQNVDSYANNDYIESHSEKGEENTESMRKIEAELEAELERLGLDMTTSGLERRLSDLLELDPDFEADFAQGEFRLDMANPQALDQSESDRDASHTPPTHSGNYAVSPRELSLRLHEVIQSRLEERVEELEAALQDSQRKVQLMELEHLDTRRKLLSNELNYSSTGQQSPTKETQPLVMNLSGEALDAYNEAYVELMKMSDSDEEDSPTVFHDSSCNGGLLPFGQRGENHGSNGSLTHFSRSNYRTSNEVYVNCSTELPVATARVQELLCSSVSEDESSECSHEMEKQLIKQIVEKTKKGSPVVLNAQRMLFSVDENEL